MAKLTDSPKLGAPLPGYPHIRPLEYQCDWCFGRGMTGIGGEDCHHCHGRRVCPNGEYPELADEDACRCVKVALGRNR